MNLAAGKRWWKRSRLIAFGASQLLALQTAFGLQIITTSLPDATQGSFFAHQLHATNGVAPYQWSLSPGSGPLPTGLSLVTNGGIFAGYVYGAPDVSGIFYFFARVTDASGATADQAIGLSISGNASPANPVALRTLHVFDSQQGAKPVGEMVQGVEGALYGACSSGGQVPFIFGFNVEVGAAFRITTDGAFTDLTESNLSSSITPADGLTLGANGDFYGSDYAGIFDLNTNGTVNYLYSFTNTTGLPAIRLPQISRPVLGLAGDLLGVTSLGVSWGSLGAISNYGTIYRIDSNGVFATLYSFTGGADGANPQAALAPDGSGAFYGTTSQGGVSNKGTIFRITANGDFESLYSFTGGSDGSAPASELLYTASGLLFGTTPTGGAGGFGTVFEVDTNGVLTTLYSFAGRSDGIAPAGKLAQGLDGNLYGTTKQGGDFGGGTIFRITTGGLLTALYGFHGTAVLAAVPASLAPPTIIFIEPLPGPPLPPPVPARRGGSPFPGSIALGPGFLLPSWGNDGSSPAGVIQGNDGSLYGVTTAGGSSNYGTIFRLDFNPAQTADLVAGSLTASTNSLTSSLPYPTVQLIWSVTNQGSGSAPGGWWDQVWVSTNGLFDEHSIPGGAYYRNGGLAPGSGYQLTNNVSLPIAASGTYSLFVQANGYGQIYEVNTNNNVTGPVSFSFTFTPPDLAPLAVMALGGATVSNTAPYPSITLSWGVTNQGTGLAPGGWWDQLWLSTNGVFDGNSIPAGAFNETNDLSAGGIVWQTNTFTLPLTNSATFTLFLQVNTSRSVFESNYLNNISAPIPGSFSLTVPDLAVVSAIVTPTNINVPRPNPEVVVTWTVTNQGSGPATGLWYDWIWLYTTNGFVSAIGPLSWTNDFLSVTGFPAPASLAPGASYSQTKSVQLPLSATGDYTVFVESDAYDYLPETNRANDLSAPVPVSFTFMPPDLAILSASAPRQILSASNFTPVTITWAVTNQGLGTAPGGWDDLVSYSPSNLIIIGGNGNQPDVAHPADLPVGGSYSATTTILLPTSPFGSTGGASYVLTVQVDSSRSIFESDYSNNVSQPLTVNITSVSPPTVIALSDSLLRIYGTAGIAYEVDYKPTGSTAWQLLTFVPMTHSPQLLSAPPGANSAWQYRATVLDADPPILDARLDGQGRSLVLFGLPTYNYTLQSATNISASTTWQPMFDYTLTNSFLFVTNPASANNDSVFYRIVEH